MMYNCIFKKYDIKPSLFYFDNNLIYFNIDKNIIVFDGLKQFKIENSIIEFILDGKLWAANLENSQTFILDNENKVIKKNIFYVAACSRNIKFFTTKNYIYPTIYVNGNFEIPIIAQISRINYELINTYEIDLVNNSVYLIKDDNLYFSKSKIEISLINFNNVKIWQLNLEDLAQSTTVYTYPELYLSNDKIYFHLGSNNRKGLFCIDVKTGNELFLYYDCFGFLVQDENFIYSSKFNNILCIVNTLTNEYSEWNVDALIKENGFESIHDHRCFAKDGLVYFTQTLGDNKSKVGILNTITKELDWKYEFEPKNGAIGSIQVSDKRLYIHTQDNTLHVFEND